MSLCRACGALLTRIFVDLGVLPLANALVDRERLDAPEPFHPLRVFICDDCLLVQSDTRATPEELFFNYVYFSSFSDTWIEHARRYAESAIERFDLGAGSLVVEVGSNDGYLLRFFRERGIPVMGVEPAENVARAARARGIPAEVSFFGRETACRLRDTLGAADLVVANNVLAHVPDLNDFIGGLAILLDGDGVLTVEFHHLLNLIRQTQFDTIYHEHFSYFSFGAAERALDRHGLAVFDVEVLPTHGGSLRLFVAHAGRRAETEAVGQIREVERQEGLDRIEGYGGFAERVARVKFDLLAFLVEAGRKGQRVAGYGAAAKGSTLLNYCGIGPEMVEYVVDRNPHKQGRCLPGTRIPVFAPERLMVERPDCLLILPWNLREEITIQMAGIRAWGGRFVAAIPRLEIW